MWNNIFNFYTFGRTAYDTTLTMEDNLDRFCMIFGNGAPMIEEIMCIVFGYSDLEINGPKLDIPGYTEISKGADVTGEVWYTHENFGSYLTGREGYGIAFAVEKRSNAIFQPDHWYIFE